MLPNDPLSLSEPRPEVVAAFAALCFFPVPGGLPRRLFGGLSSWSETSSVPVATWRFLFLGRPRGRLGAMGPNGTDTPGRSPIPSVLTFPPANAMLPTLNRPFSRAAEAIGGRHSAVGRGPERERGRCLE